MSNVIPEGYKKNAHGDLVHINNIKQIDLERDDVVKSIIQSVKSLNTYMSDIKLNLFADFHAFIELSAEEYDVKLGGKKGNVTLYSFDGQYRVDLAIQERIAMDERINAAKELIDQCIRSWSEGSNHNIVSLINQAFKVDKQGNLNTRRILELRTVEIDDQRWKRAMDAISDSVKVIDSKSYMRFYERDDDGEYHQISLDFSAV